MITFKGNIRVERESKERRQKMEKPKREKKKNPDEREERIIKKVGPYTTQDR